MTREELRHVGGRASQAGKRGDAGCGEDEAQRALMLVEGRRLEPFFGCGTDNERRHLAAAVVDIELISFVESDDQQSAALK